MPRRSPRPALHCLHTCMLTCMCLSLDLKWHHANFTSTLKHEKVQIAKPTNHTPHTKQHTSRARCRTPFARFARPPRMRNFSQYLTPYGYYDIYHNNSITPYISRKRNYNNSGRDSRKPQHMFESKRQKHFLSAIVSEKT